MVWGVCEVVWGYIEVYMIRFECSIASKIQILTLTKIRIQNIKLGSSGSAGAFIPHPKISGL